MREVQAGESVPCRYQADPAGRRAPRRNRLPGPGLLPDEAAFHFAMDGSAKGQTAGAGAVLWARREHGRWERIAEAAVSMGSKMSPTCAEAWGLSAAVDFLLTYGGSERRVHISGDCLMVVRFCAEQGRMREYSVQRIAERALPRIAGAGWSCAWTVVPRKHNCAADSVDRRARCRAIAQRGSASCPRVRRARVSWFVDGFAAPPAQPWLAPRVSRVCGGRLRHCGLGAPRARTIPSPLGGGRATWRITSSAPTRRTGIHGCGGRCPTASMSSRCS